MAVAALNSLCDVAQSNGIDCVLVTGGDGQVLARHCVSQVSVHPDLVFEGLECVFGHVLVSAMDRGLAG